MKQNPILVFILSLAFCCSAIADNLTTAARAAVTKYQNAVVHVKLLAKIKFAGREEPDEKIEVLGTVVDPTGLTLVSARSIDPAALMTSFMGSFQKMPDNMTFESELSETVIVLPDGMELKADILIKDPELDLAMIRPKDTSRKFDFVSFSNPVKKLLLLDEFFVISRLSAFENRAVALTKGNVKSIIKTPRLFYITSQEGGVSVGCPAFDLEGSPLGIFVLRDQGSTENKMSKVMSMMAGGGLGASAILRPNSELLEIITQAKAEEK